MNHVKIDSLPNYRRVKQLVIFAVATLILLSIAFSAWKSIDEYRLTIRGAELQTRGYASALKEHAERTLSEADTTLLDVVEHIEEHGGINSRANESLGKVLRFHSRGTPQIASIFLVSRNGQILNHSVDVPIKQVDVTDRDYFIHHRDNPAENSSFLSKPLKNRLNGKWRIILSRPIMNTKGTFDGLVAAALDLDYFRKFYATLDLGNGGKIVIVRRDGELLLTVPLKESDYGSDFKNSHLMRTYLPRAPKGTFHIPGGQALLESNARIISYDSQDKFPVVAVANIDKDEVLGHWVKNSYIQAALVASISAALCLLSLGLLRYIRRIEDAHQMQRDQQMDIAASAKEWQSTFDAMEDVIWIMDQNRHILRANKATERIFGARLDMAFGRKCCEVSHNQSFPVADCPFQTMLDSGHCASMQYLIGERWYKISVDPVKNDAGVITGAVHIIDDIDDMKRAEEQLRKKEQEFRTLAENSPDIIVRYDRECRRIYVNPAFERVNRLSAQEALGKSPIELSIELAPMAAPFTHRLKEVLETGIATQIDLAWTKDGEDYCWFVRAIPEFNADGEVVCALTIWIDITKRKRSEVLLLKREQEFRSLAENMPDNIVRYDCDGRTLYINPSLERTLGLPAADIIGKSPMELYPDGRFAEYAAMLNKVMVNGVASEMEMVFPDVSGKFLYHQVRFIPERDHDGTIIGTLAIGRDFTERRRSEEELSKLSSAIEQSPVTIVITDAGGNIEFVNPKFTELTGYLPEEALGMNLRILKSGETSPEEYKNLWGTITSGEVWHGEFLNRKKNGEYFREYATIAPVKSKAGVITHYIAIKEDITEKKKLEDQLRQSQKMEAIGQLAGGVAHDFNNLLQVITIYGFLIRKLFKEHALPVTFVDEQMAAARRAVELTGALLTFSRKQTLNPKPVDLNLILNESRKLLMRMIGEDIDFEVTPAPGEIIVRADDSAMHQVLMNLATNARDAMTKGGRLTISISRVQPDAVFSARHNCDNSGEFALISVTDTGDGVSPEDLQRIFEPFFTTKEPGKGTGLGLAIIHGIIHQHNGYIEVESVKGEGTSFRIYLPLLLDQTATNQREPEVEIPPASGTILLVEDELMVRLSLKSVISGCGYLVLEAVDGEDAVKVFRENAGRVDLLIMDMIMPKKNGWEALQEIRTIDPEIRNIFLSGYTADILESKGIEEGDELLIMKPVAPPLLLEAIRKQLHQD